MSTRLNLSDAINMTYTTGQNPTFEYEGNIYTFSPEGIITFVGENLDIPVYEGVLSISNGMGG